MRRFSVHAVVGVLCVVTTSLHADTVHLASYGHTMYRHTDGVTETFPLEDGVFAMHADLETGTVLALGNVQDGGIRIVYIVQNAASGPLALTPYSSTSQHYGSFTKIGALYYGFHHDELYSINFSDPGNPVETLIDTTGIQPDGGAAYDPATDTLYMGSANGTLYTVDYSTAVTTPVGPFGIDVPNLGMEWCEGQLYIAAQNTTTGHYEIGTVDTQTGAYSFGFTLPPPAAAVPTALAIIPESAGIRLDIKPGSCPNSFNPKSRGVLPASILGTLDFDVAMIDVSSLLLSRADGIGASVAPLTGPPGPYPAFEDTGTPFEGGLCDCYDMEGDGFIDLAVFFPSPAPTVGLGLGALSHGAEVELVLSGTLIDDRPFAARDCIRIVSPGVSNHPVGDGPTFQRARPSVPQLRR